jgi:hypothetical protein
VERYQNDWKFVLIFLKILNVSWVFIDPLSIPPKDQLKSTKWLLKYIIWTFKRLSLYDKEMSGAEIIGDSDQDCMTDYFTGLPVFLWWC